eukprot:364645-Chlamydomonas_euryale.AAC.1
MELNMNPVPAAAVIQGEQALSGMIGRKASVGGRTPAAKALYWAETDTERRKLRERIGLDKSGTLIKKNAKGVPL